MAIANDLSVDLDDFIAQPTPLELLESEPTAAPDPEYANRLLRRLHRLAESADQIRAIAGGEVARISAWEEERLDSLRVEEDWITRSLEGFMHHHRVTTHERSLKLPNGTLALRKPSTRLIVDSDEELLAWAKVHAAIAVKRTESVLKSKIPAAPEISNGSGPLITKDGEVVPGVHAEQDTIDSFTVKLGGEA